MLNKINQKNFLKGATVLKLKCKKQISSDNTQIIKQNTPKTNQ